MPLQQLTTVGTPGRDPRGWTVSVVFWGWLEDAASKASAGDDAANATWWPLNDLPPLAFDHGDILKTLRRALDGYFGKHRTMSHPYQPITIYNTKE